MARIKHSLTKDDLAKVGRGAEPPKPGTYRAKIVEVNPETPKDKDPRIAVIYEITSKGEGNGYRLYDYLTESPASKWKKDQFFVAAGLVQTVGGKIKVLELDTDKVHKLPEVLVRVKHETYNDETRAKPQGVFPLDDDDPDETDADEDDDAAEDEDEGEEAEVEADEDAEDAEVPDFSEMTAKEIRAWFADAEIEIPDDLKGLSKLRAWAEENAAPFEEDAEADADDEDAEGDEEELDLDAMSIKELRELAEENEIDHKGLKIGALRAKLAEELGDEEDAEDEDAEDADEDEAVDYSDWSLADLKAELEARDLKTVGPKTTLIKRLEKSDESDPV
jgi:SAP domain-containing protein